MGIMLLVLDIIENIICVTRPTFNVMVRVEYLALFLLLSFEYI